MAFDSIEKNINVYVILENLETGEKTYLAPRLIAFEEDSRPGESGSSEASIAIAYEVGIPGYMLGAALPLTNEQSFWFPDVAYATEQKYMCDSTSSVCATLTFYYQEGQQNGREWMYSQKMRNVWTRQDPQVSWSNGILKARCGAEWFDKAGTCNSVTSGNVPNPVSGTGYEMVPSFAGSNNKTLVDDINYQVASQEISLQRGGNHWNFYVCIVNGGGGVIYGCY
ncbi:MAG: hypothetical protein HND44_24325 [Chloroflexi bacterium]|nr:hypothetical protein [Ardenticatenaceae bacterium]MBL1131553.1 hypothetical protein [Chloroflexota bacterium]NOG37665.1 hypothetical protein [Chloroflexota bacterium]